MLAVGLGQLKLEQPEISISRARDKSAHISCKLPTEHFIGKYTYWYRYKPDQGLEYLIYVLSTTPVQGHLGGKKNKLVASKDSHSSTSTLKINFLEEKDEAVYYCACWTGTHNVRVAKITYIRTIFGYVPNHILLNMGIHRSCTAGQPA